MPSTSSNPEIASALNIPAHDVTNEILPNDKLTVAAAAQRAINDTVVNKMAAAFIPSAMGTLVVSEREGCYYVVDGQHRRAAALKNGWTEFRCEVHHGLTPAQEAALFLVINRESKRVNVADTYRVGLTAQIPLYVLVEAVLRSRDLQMGVKGENGIRAVQTVLRIARLYGAEPLARAIDTAEYAFGRHDGTFDGLILAGLGKFFHHHPEIATSDLGDRIKKRGTVDTWIQYVNAEATAQGKRHSGTYSRELAGYIVFLEAWNRGRSRRMASAVG